MTGYYLLLYLILIFIAGFEMSLDLFVLDTSVFAHPSGCVGVCVITNTGACCTRGLLKVGSYTFPISMVHI